MRRGQEVKEDLTKLRLRLLVSLSDHDWLWHAD